MQVKTVDSPIVITKVNDHEKHKETLLSYINIFNKDNDTDVSSDDMGFSGTKKSNVKSDWVLPRGEYLKYFYDSVIQNNMTEIKEYLNMTQWAIENGWFQQYAKGGKHNWHCHTGTQFTNCYYLELPDANYKTEIKDLNGNLINIDVKEGDLLTFPAYLLHRSKSNGNKRKTVISFNSNFAK